MSLDPVRSPPRATPPIVRLPPPTGATQRFRTLLAPGASSIRASAPDGAKTSALSRRRATEDALDPPATSPRTEGRSRESCLEWRERDDLERGTDTRHTNETWDILDPSCRSLAALCPPEPLSPCTPTDPADRVRSSSVEQLFGALVKRIAWSMTPDRTSGTVRLEIGAGELEGTIVLITSEPQGLSVVLDGPPGIDLEAWKHRLCQRLASIGLAATFP